MIKREARDPEKAAHEKLSCCSRTLVHVEKKSKRGK